MGERTSYNYHIFGLIRGNRKNMNHYVADGPAHYLDTPLVADDLVSLARRLDVNHEMYLQEIDNEINKTSYIGFSFALPCEKVIYNGNIFHTQQLSETEQRQFMQRMRKNISYQFNHDN